MRVLVLLVATIVFANVLWAQNDDRGITNDPKAKALLDKVSAKYMQIKTLEVVFNVTIKSAEDDLEESFGGQAYLKDDKYRVITDQLEVICDNVKRWMIMKEEQEVQVNFYEPDAENIESPTALFTIYKENYYYRMNAPQTINGKKVQVVELIPVNLDEAVYERIFLYIDDKDVISRARIIGKDKVEYIWEITEFNELPRIDDDIFVFNEEDYPDFHIEDLTK